MLRDWKRGVAVTLDPWGNPIGGLTDKTIQPWMQEKVFVLVEDLDLLTEVVDAAIEAGACVVDIESQGLDTRMYVQEDGKVGPNHKIVGFALCYDGEVGFYVPVRHTSEDSNIAHPDNGNLPLDATFAQINRLLTLCKTIYHNSNFDLEIMHAEGLQVPNELTDWDKFDDTQIMGWLIDSNRKRIGLKALTNDILGWKMIEFKSLFPKEAKKKLRFDELHPEEAYIYASSDSICTYHLWLQFKDHPNLAKQKVIHRVEKMLVTVLRTMVRNQFLIDTEYLKGLDADLEAKCEEYVAEIRRLCDDPSLSVDSPKQLGEVLFDKLGIPTEAKTATGQWKTDRQTLEDLDKKYNGKYPALTMVVKYRQMQKLRGTYIHNLIHNVDQFSQARFGIQACGAPTGRFAAPGGKGDQGYSGCNAQAIPKVKKDKPNIRKAFIARPGFVIAAIDFAGVELRIAGNLSREKKWIDEFAHAECVAKYGDKYDIINPSPLWHHCPYCHKKVGDIHSQTSEAVFGTAEEPYRSKSKGVNFGILYGAGGKTLAANIGVTTDEGYRIQKTFLDNLPGIKRWIKRQHKQAHKTQEVATAFGRLRLVPEVGSDEKRLVAFGERTAVNSPIQGTSADITKIAMVGCHRLIKKNGWGEDCRILLTVHDEIVFEVRDSMKEEILPALGLVMCKCAPKGWGIPLTVDIEYGRSWGEVDNAWKPPAPRLKPLNETILPLHPGDLYFDGTVMTADGEKGEMYDPESEATAAPTPPAPKPESKPDPEPASKPVDAPVAAPAPQPAPTPTPAPVAADVPAQATDDVETQILEHVVRRPYTKFKHRKLEALFILAGGGTTRLRLLSDSGADLTKNRVIMVDPVYFKLKAAEWEV